MHNNVYIYIYRYIVYVMYLCDVERYTTILWGGMGRGHCTHFVKCCEYRYGRNGIWREGTGTWMPQNHGIGALCCVVWVEMGAVSECEG